MVWQVWADFALGLAVPLTTALLYFSGRIQHRHLKLMAWGFAVGSTWEFTNYFLGDTHHAMKVAWPMPLITLHILHTFWDAGLFIIGFWLCMLILKTSESCTRFSWTELAIMCVWGAGQEFIVELLGNGVIWEYKVRSWNPVWITIGSQGYTLVPQLIWVLAPVIYYLGFIRINQKAAR
jgi:hypothetical protein